MELKETIYRDHACIDFSNGTIGLHIAKDCGPRVLFAGFKGETNLFASAPNEMKTPNGPWKIYGGHRLWLAPEVFPDTYYPDNDEVDITRKGKALVFGQELIKPGIRKEMEFEFTAENKLKATHTVYNRGKKNLKFAAWALSVMEKGGFAIIPQNLGKEDEGGFLPTKNVVLWRYANYKDERWGITEKYFYVRQGGEKPFKIGQRVPAGWAGYFLEGYLFIKRFKFEREKEYIDFDSNVEVYSCKNFLELETLSPLTELKPGESYSYGEDWEFYKGRQIAFGSAEIELPQ